MQANVKDTGQTPARPPPDRRGEMLLVGFLLVVGVLGFSDLLHHRAAAAQVIVLVALAGVVGWILWQHRAKQFARQQAEAEEQHRILRQRFEGLTRYASDLIVTLDRENRVIDANPRALKALGYTVAEIQRLMVYDLHPPEKHPEVDRLLKCIQEKGEAVFELPVMRKDRSCFPAEINACHVTIQGREYYQGIFRDLSERKRTASALRESNLFNQTVISNAGEGIIVYDPELRYRVWNRFMEQITGLKESEVLGKKAVDLFPHLREYGVDRLLERALKGETVAMPEAHYRVPSTGKSGWTCATYAPHFDANGRILGVIGIVHDITERKRAEEALRQSKATVEAVFESTRDGILVANAKTRKFVVANESICQMLGYRHDELLQLDMADIHPAENLPQVIGEFERQAKSELTFAPEIPVKRKDGSVFFADISSTRIEINGQTCMVGVFRDITERKRAEHALRESEALIRGISNNLVAGMIYQVIRMNDGTRKFTYLSDAVRQLYGISPEEGLADANRIYGRVHPEDQARVLQEEEAAHRALSVFRTTVRMINPDGTIRWSSFVSSPRKMGDGTTCWDGMELDVTEHKQAQEALRQSEERFLIAFQNAPVPMAIATLQEGRFIEVNQRFLTTMGYRIEEIIGKTSREIGIYANFAQRDALIRRIQTGGLARDFPCDIVTRNGDLRHGFFTAGIIELQNQKHLFAIYRDVTEQRQLEAEILQISEREQRRIGQDLHDSLSQNLTGIACLVKILREKLTDKSPAESADATRIAELVGQALSESRALARGLYPVKLDAGGLMSALQELAESVESIFHLTCSFDCREAILVEDVFKATHLYRIAQEAINNVLKHGQATAASIRLESDGDEITLSIQDNGKGIPDDLPSSGGMGLRIMEYRARAIGASFKIGRGPRGGAIVTCAFRVDR